VIQDAITAEFQRVGSLIGAVGTVKYVTEKCTKVVDGQTREYSECLFTQMRLNKDSAGCTTLLTNGEEPIFGNDTFEENEEISTIKAYIKESGYDRNVINFLVRTYGGDIKFTKTPSGEKKINVNIKPKDMLTRRTLIKPNEFMSIMGSKSSNQVSFRIKTCFVNERDSLIYCTLITTRSNSEDRIDMSQIEEDEWEASLKTNILSKNTKKLSGDMVEEDPDDFE
jgi:hypothetical protein